MTGLDFFPFTKNTALTASVGETTRDLVLLMDMPHVMWDGRLLASLCVPTVRRNERIAFVVHVEETDTLHSQSNDDPMVCHNPLS